MQINEVLKKLLIDILCFLIKIDNRSNQFDFSIDCQLRFFDLDYVQILRFILIIEFKLN